MCHLLPCYTYNVSFHNPEHCVSSPLHPPRLVEMSVQTEEKLSTGMTQHGGMHQRMWLSPSLSPSQSSPVCSSSSSSLSCCGQVHMQPCNYQVYFLQRSKSLFLWA